MEDLLIYLVIAIVCILVIEILSRIKYKKIRYLLDENKNKSIKKAEITNIKESETAIVGSTTYIIDAKTDDGQNITIYTETLRLYNKEELIRGSILGGIGDMSKEAALQAALSSDKNNIKAEEVQIGSIINVAEYKNKYISQYDIKTYSITRKRCIIIEAIIGGGILFTSLCWLARNLLINK